MATSSKKRKPAAKSRKAQPPAGMDRRWSILLYSLGAFFVLLSVLPSEAAAWMWMRTNLLFGIFGVSGWFVGPLLIYAGVLIMQEKPFAGVLVKGFVVFASLCGTVLVFGTVDFTGADFAEVIKRLFETGTASVFGAGFFSVFFGYTLWVIGGKIVARIVIVFFLIGSLMLFTGTTPGDIVRFVRQMAEKIPQPPVREEKEEPDADDEDEGELIPAAEKAPVFDVEAKPRRGKKSIDIPLEARDVVLSEPGPGQMEEVTIPVGGTFGKRPLDELAHGEYGVQLPGKAPGGGVLLFGEDDPLAPEAKQALAQQQSAVYDYELEDPFVPPPAPKEDLFGRAHAPVPKQAQQMPQTPETVVSQAESAFAGESTAPVGDEKLEALIDKAAAEKPDQQVAAKDMQEADAPFSEPYRYPPLTLFAPSVTDDASGAKEEMRRTADLLVKTLESFGVQTRILDVSRGPSVTRYEVQPQAGVKISRITNLADDIALNLSAAGVRIEAPIPGKPAVGIEVPNRKKTAVSIRGILENTAFADSTSALPIALGKDIAGDCVVADLTRMPHLLVAGSTGSGKSVCINSTIMSFLYKSSPEDMRLLLIDPKVVELAEYNGIPHLLMPVVTEPRKAAGALGAMVAEMEKRYHLFAENNVRDIKTFNKLAVRHADMEKLPYIAIVIDELADLMMTAGKEVEDYICRLAQKARAAGMHLVVATQRPSVDVITGLIKANIPSRIAFAVSSQVDSRTILDGTGAEKLLGMGDMLFMPVGANKPVRVQGTYVKDKEISDVLNFIRQSGGARYDEGLIQEMEKRATTESSSEGGGEGDDSILNDATFVSAVEMALEAGQISTSHIQRRLRLGYARAGRIVDEMERLGIVSGPNGSKPREVLIGRQQWLELSMNSSD